MKYGDTQESIQVLMARYLTSRGLDSADISEAEYVIKSTCDGSDLVTRTLLDGIVKDDSISTLNITLTQANYDQLEPSTRYINILRIKMSGASDWLYHDWSKGFQSYITFSANCFL